MPTVQQGQALHREVHGLPALRMPQLPEGKQERKQNKSAHHLQGLLGEDGKAQGLGASIRAKAD